MLKVVCIINFSCMYYLPFHTLITVSIKQPTTVLILLNKRGSSVCRGHLVAERCVYNRFPWSGDGCALLLTFFHFMSPTVFSKLIDNVHLQGGWLCLAKQTNK